MRGDEKIRMKKPSSGIKTLDRKAVLMESTARVSQGIKSFAKGAAQCEKENRTAPEAEASERVIRSGHHLAEDAGKGMRLAAARGRAFYIARQKVGRNDSGSSARSASDPLAKGAGRKKANVKTRIRENTAGMMSSKRNSVRIKNGAAVSARGRRVFMQKRVLSGMGRAEAGGRKLFIAKAAKNVAAAKSAGRMALLLKKAIHAIILAAKGLAMLLMAGGWIVLVILIVVVIISAIVSSPLGIFFSNDPNAGGTPTREVVSLLNDEFSDMIWALENEIPHDELEIVYTGGASAIDWKGVLAVYVPLVNQRENDAVDVLSFDEEKINALRAVMDDMNAVSAETRSEISERTVTKTDDDGETVETSERYIVTILRITVTQRTPYEMADVYAFTAVQRKALNELLSAEYESLWAELLGGFTAGGGSGIPWDGRVPTSIFSWPLEEAGTITSPFGSREDPFTGKTANHNGLDIAVPMGTKILAAADGVVTYSNALDSYGGGLGYYVSLSHAGGYASLYAHCSSVAVKTGDSVKKGQVIACVGNTGRSKGPHLHWETRAGGVLTDPMSYFE